MVDMLPTEINGKWTIILPEHRHVRPEWPHWEQERLASMYEHLEPGDVVFDVGAEEGDFPGLWASWGCDVVLFEPNPRVWPNIRAIWEANGFKQPLDWWVGFAGDFVEKNPPQCDIDQKARDGWPICAYGEIIGDHGFRHLAQETKTTPTISIDCFCKERNVYPDAITMDVEGSELRVLNGASGVLRDKHPKVWVSVHTDKVWMDEQYNGVKAEDVVKFMAKFGYEGTHLATDHEEHWVFL